MKLTLEQILDRDVPAIRDYAQKLVAQGIIGTLHVYYAHEAICAKSDLAPFTPFEDEGWTYSSIDIPANIPYSSYWSYLYQRMGRVPIYA